MNYISRHIALLLITTVCSLNILSCGSKGESDDEPITPPPSPPPLDGITQQQIEEMADRSLDEVDIEGSFSFETQRMVSVDLHFSESQDNTKISIYAIKNNVVEPPGNLLEQGVLYNSSRYRGMLSVPTFINSLTVISSGDLSETVVINIDKYNRAHYEFEEVLL